MTKEVMTFEEALDTLSIHETIHPKGIDKNWARIGHALDSETLEPVSVWSQGQNIPWETQKTPTTPLKPWNEYAPWIHQNWGKGEAYPDFNSFPGTVIKHRNGHTYLALGIAFHKNEQAGVYVRFENETPSGPWWVRPWSMFTPDRFAYLGKSTTFPL